MSFLEDKNRKTNEIDLSKDANVEFEKFNVESQMQLGKPSGSDTDEFLVLDLDQELKKEDKKDDSTVTPDVSKPAINLPKMKPGLGVIGGGSKVPSTPSVIENKDAEISAKLPDNGVNGFSSSFSLLPVDEDSILYVDFPEALRRILYSFVAGGILLLGLWFGANYYLDRYFVQANDLQQQIRALSLEKLKYQTTDVDVRLRYQFYKTLQQLLTNHITWQHFFALLEKYTAPEVHFTNFSVNIMNDINQIMFSSYASDLKSGLKQYMVLKKYASEFCENVTI
ncbi:MAG: hypothetical protein Q8K02_08540, partial [Flavobacterium sp.]|nr:hypothetical protein [Flavobacterium sp.]